MHKHTKRISSYAGTRWKRAHEAYPTISNMGQNQHRCSLGPTCNRHEMVVARRPHLGAAAPLHAPTASSFHVASPGGSSMMVTCRIS